MRIDASHRPWALATAAVLALAVLVYLFEAIYRPEAARGSSWPGLVYGFLGYGMMLYAALLGARKKRPLWRVGRAQAWMRGHLWMGALSFPMILLHAAFRAGGPLTTLLMALLTITVLSGITGALLQHYVPKRITASVPLETIYEQIPVVREQLRQEASGIMELLLGAFDEEQGNSLRQAYRHDILPYLGNPENARSPLANAVKARSFFDALRRHMPGVLHEPIADLEGICEEERQLTVQRRMYLLLHGWLLVHVPLSIVLLILGAVHAFVAVHY